MPDTVDQLYLDIAKAMESSIDNPWQVAIINFEYTEDSGEFDCVFKERLSDDKEIDFDVDFKMYKRFKHLREIMRRDDGSQWKCAQFTLFRTGEFNIEFEWD